MLTALFTQLLRTFKRKEAMITTQIKPKPSNLFKDLLTSSTSPASNATQKVLEIETRELLMKQGKRADYLYFLLEGKVLLGKDLDGPTEQVVDIIMPQSLIGLDALKSNSKYSVYARALTPLKVLEISQSDFHMHYQSNIALHNFVRNQLSSRLFNANKKYIQLHSNISFYERTKQFLVELFQKHGQVNEFSTVIEMNITHRELAQYMYASRQSVSMLLSNLKKAGIINYNRSQLEVYCLDRLNNWKINSDA